MKIIILGSGGCTPIPRPTCQCKICIEARDKGIPYERGGSSIYIEGLKAIIDTPEESKEQINRENIKEINSIFYTHWHPDHTSGMRIIEYLRSDFLAEFIENKQCSNPINVYALEEVIEDLLEIGKKGKSYFNFYKNKNLINLIILQNNEIYEVNNYKITGVYVKNITNSTIYVIEKDQNKVIYAPCNIKPVPIENERIKNPDILILGKVIPDGKLKNNYLIPKGNILMNDVFTIKEALHLKKQIGAKRLIVTHIEEDFARSFDHYKEIEKEYDHKIEFAYDGMVINLIAHTKTQSHKDK